jgi:hypothetical protein
MYFRITSSKLALERGRNTYTMCRNRNPTRIWVLVFSTSLSLFVSYPTITTIAWKGQDMYQHWDNMRRVGDSEKLCRLELELLKVWASKSCSIGPVRFHTVVRVACGVGRL